MNIMSRILRVSLIGIVLALAACGGGGETQPVPPPDPPPPPSGTVVGAAGGTVDGPNGSRVVIPAGALTANTAINIEQTSVGAPALPGGFPASGAMFAFTPHGTVFAIPVTITIPFDPATIPSGNIPVLYKTNDQSQFARVPGALFGASSVSAEVTGFSFEQVVIEPLTPDQLLRHVQFEWDPNLKERVDDNEGVLDERRLVGPAGIFEIPFDGDNTSALEAFSAADAVPFWVASESGKGRVFMQLDRSFIKETDGATLEIVVTVALAEAIDHNGPPLFDECPYGPSLSSCSPISALVVFDAELTRVTPAGEDFVYQPDEEFPEEEGDEPVLDTGGYIHLQGRMGLWSKLVGDDAFRTTSPFNFQNVVRLDDINGDSAASHPRMRTLGQLVIPVDLSQVKRFERFWINTHLSASTRNGRGRESGVGAYIRDPARVGGAEFRFTGVRPSGAPRPTPRLPRKPIDCPSNTTDPQAGQLQFVTLGQQLHEGRSVDENSVIEVERIGGTRGSVSALLTVGGGTATAGVHYEPLTNTVVFGDGQAGPKVIGFETPQNTLAEPARTVIATLSAPGGCASLGENSATTVTILDDELTPQPPTLFTVGGTVTGLTAVSTSGRGLELIDHHGLSLIITADGPFTFTNIPSPTGTAYSVRTGIQPLALGNVVSRVCAVTANGSGVFANANVTNVQVTCTEP